MTKLYSNGCSFTYGQGLKDPNNKSWPALVAKKYNSEFLNHAVMGGSNDRIVKGVVSNIKNYDKFYIGWSSVARFVKYNPVNNFEILFTPALNLNVSLHYNNDLRTNYKKYKDFGEMYYKYWYNELYEFKGFLHQIILLQSLFRLHNKEYTMINILADIEPWLSSEDTFAENVKDLICFDFMSDNQIHNEREEIVKLVDQIDISKFVFWKHNVDKFIKDNNLTVSTKDAHPNEDGHRAIAEEVLLHDSTQRPNS